MFWKRTVTIPTDYKGRCGNCHALFPNKKDKYCVYCGTKRGEGAFEPFQNIASCIYGPPPKKHSHKCKVCGHQWSYIAMLDDQKFCSRCGGPSE